MTSIFKAAIIVLALAACTQPALTNPPAAPPPPTPIDAGEGNVCGGIAGVACGEGLYCLYEGGHCGENDQSGRCRTLPTACTLEMAPVCGCNGRTYSSASCAAVAGVSVASPENCERLRRSLN